MAEHRYRRARAYRHGELLCGGVYVTVKADTRLGIAPRERRDIAAYFLEHLAASFRHELAQLVHRRGAAAQRAAESLEPIELVFDDPRLGTQRIVGRVVPPQVRRGELQEIQFGLRELRLAAVSDAE
ncbi:MAG: hypothetical protein ACRDLN_04235 [Solirubrobacteraceae bacterium]